LNENLTEVLIWSFPKTEVKSVMRIETQVLKNKVFKIQVLKTYLTLKRIHTVTKLMQLVRRNM